MMRNMSHSEGGEHDDSISEICQALGVTDGFDGCQDFYMGVQEGIEEMFFEWDGPSFEDFEWIFYELGYEFTEEMFELIQSFDAEPGSQEFSENLQEFGSLIGLTDEDEMIQLYMDVMDAIDNMYGDHAIPPFEVLQDMFEEFGYDLTEDIYFMIIELDMDPENPDF